MYDAVRAVPVTGVHHNRSQWVPFKHRNKRKSINEWTKEQSLREKRRREVTTKKDNEVSDTGLTQLIELFLFLFFDCLFVSCDDRLTSVVSETDCILNQVGKPVYYRDSDSEWGSWMQDSAPKSPEDESKFWMTTQNDPGILFEFANKDAFRHKNVTKSYALPFQFVGNSHIIHGGHFFYNQLGTNKLIKYDLSTNHTYFRSIEDASIRDDTGKLYETQHNFMDIMAEENGLWVVFAGNSTNNTLIIKFDSISLGTENVWNITLDHQTIGDMFIACGILYGVESSTETFTKIRFAFDLYLNTPLEVSVNFTNPFKHNNLISYNARHEKILGWDSRNLIEYPLRFLENVEEANNEDEQLDD